MTIEFRKPVIEDKALITGYIKQKKTRSCEDTFGNLLLWARFYNVQIAEVEGMLVSASMGEKISFHYPYGAGNAKNHHIVHSRRTEDLLHQHVAKVGVVGDGGVVAVDLPLIAVLRQQTGQQMSKQHQYQQGPGGNKQSQIILPEIADGKMIGIVQKQLTGKKQIYQQKGKNIALFRGFLFPLPQEPSQEDKQIQHKQLFKQSAHKKIPPITAQLYTNYKILQPFVLTRTGLRQRAFSVSAWGNAELFLESVAKIRRRGKARVSGDFAYGNVGILQLLFCMVKPDHISVFQGRSPRDLFEYPQEMEFAHIAHPCIVIQSVIQLIFRVHILDDKGDLVKIPPLGGCFFFRVSFQERKKRKKPGCTESFVGRLLSLKLTDDLLKYVMDGGTGLGSIYGRAFETEQIKITGRVEMDIVKFPRQRFFINVPLGFKGSEKDK